MDAKQFLSQIAGTSWDMDALTALARQHGYAFSADELATAADALWGSLSEDDLRGIAGGRPGNGNGRPDPGPNNVHEFPPPGQNRDSDTFSPPPGDVSGNSCFFIRPR